MSIVARAREDGAGGPQLTPEQIKEMQAYQEAGEVTQKQRDLATFQGTWDAVVDFWMAPGAPPNVSKGTEERTMMLGGRYMRCAFESDFMGMPFQGEMMLGFDNVLGVWQSNWCDSMSTAMMRGTGTENKDGSINWTFVETNPVTKSLQETWGFGRDVSEDKQVMEFWKKVDGKDVKIMQITFTRRK